jgi:hypothetical protein
MSGFLSQYGWGKTQDFAFVAGYYMMLLVLVSGPQSENPLQWMRMLRHIMDKTAWIKILILPFSG